MGSAHLRQVSRIPTTWLDRGNASDQRSRGLQRANNQCLMLSVLQCFMHQPQLLWWLEMHNQTVRHGRLSTIKNACNTDEMPYCVACALIDLMNEYWANTNSTQPIPNPGPVLDRIEDIALIRNAAELNGNDRTHQGRGEKTTHRTK